MKALEVSTSAESRKAKSHARYSAGLSLEAPLPVLTLENSFPDKPLDLGVRAAPGGKLEQYRISESSLSRHSYFMERAAS
jgi:hypothetical protein